jgi:tetratricopeptide (TPR) repeat protein
MLCAVNRVAEAKRDPMQNREELEFNPPPYIELAQQAIVAGDLSAAIRVLKAARACWAEHQEKCGFTQIDFDSLAGVVYLERGQAKNAVRLLEGVVAKQPNRTMAWFYLGQARLRLSRYREAAEALTEAAPVGSKIPEYHGMLVRAWRGAKEEEKARLALAAGLRRFPVDPPLLFEGTTLYLSKGLFHAALDLARRHAAAPGKNADLAFLMVAESYRNKGWLRDTIATLEEAMLLCGDDSQAATRLAYAYVEDGQPLSAARLFDRLSAEDPSFLQAASEQYRLAGHTLEAQRLAMRIEEETQRRAQLAVIHLQMDGFDAVVQLLMPLAKSGRLDDQGSFRLAYAALRSGRLELARELLSRLKGTPLGDPAEQLHRALAGCEVQTWRCW